MEHTCILGTVRVGDSREIQNMILDSDVIHDLESLVNHL
jgi:hypothetical protein